MLMRLLTLLVILLLAAACQPAAPANLPPTPAPFPTMTLGRQIQGLLPTVVALPLDGGLANPATAIAQANRPTATPNYAQCPPLGSPALPSLPASGAEMSAAILRFLAEGGAAAALANGLAAWGVLGQADAVRGDVDFVGAGIPQVVAAYRAPDDGGTLLILGCQDGRAAPLYQAITGGKAPLLIAAGDLTADGRPEALFASRQCSADAPDDCAYRTQLITWNAAEGRFVSLLRGAITSPEPPQINDIDNDRVVEIVVRLTSAGTRATGPLRTGVNIYDWNGEAYVLSIIQLDPPRFQIQIIHEADRAFARQEMAQAARLYELARTEPGLRFWLNDEPSILNSYTLYRLILLYAYTEDDRLLPAYQALLQTFPDPLTAPVYVSLANAFWNALQVTNNLRSACIEVQAIISARPEAVSLLNRYGSRSPTYTAADLCPF